MRIIVNVDNDDFAASLERNSAAAALVDLLEKRPLTLSLSDYAGFEKVGSLEQSLPEENRRLTAVPGDIVLYQGDQIVFFYGSNSWSYTPLAHIDDLSGWENALGSGDVTVTLTLER